VRKTIIAGNWKMHKTIKEGLSFLEELLPKLDQVSEQAFLAPPFTAIASMAKKAASSNILIGAQNMSHEEKGALTGEVSAGMLLDAGAAFVILGHSERRQLFGETDLLINKKVRKALGDGLQPILCVGETQEEREAGRQEEVVASQLQKSLEGMTEPKNLAVAYEPVWAIGTGLTATKEIAQEMHSLCRSTLKELFGDEAAEKISILYGGSVKPDNSKELIDQPDIDGLLIGGASLDCSSFYQILESVVLNPTK